MANSIRKDFVASEPALDEDEFYNSEVVRDLDDFKARADVIVANRSTDVLADVAHKIYTRDICGRDRPGCARGGAARPCGLICEDGSHMRR